MTDLPPYDASLDLGGLPGGDVLFDGSTGGSPEPPVPPTAPAPPTGPVATLPHQPGLVETAEDNAPRPQPAGPPAAAPSRGPVPSPVRGRAPRTTRRVGRTRLPHRSNRPGVGAAIFVAMAAVFIGLGIARGPIDPGSPTVSNEPGVHGTDGGHPGMSYVGTAAGRSARVEMVAPGGLRHHVVVEVDGKVRLDRTSSGDVTYVLLPDEHDKVVRMTVTDVSEQDPTVAREITADGAPVASGVFSRTLECVYDPALL